MKKEVELTKRADLSSFEPSRDAVEMEGVVANTPSDAAFFVSRRLLVCLALDAKVHDVIAADGAGIHV